MQTSFTLNNGKKIPALGLGTWKAEPEKVGDAVRYALTEAGYRHIDCASLYGNEKEIGEVFGEVLGKQIPREDVFITGKLWNNMHRPEDVEKACRQTLEDLQLEYLDLYLMHYGVAFKSGDDLRPVDENGYILTENVSIQQTWQAMEELVDKGLIRSIGISNFTVPMLVDLLTYAKVSPVVNQVETHPHLTQTSLLGFCRRNEILVTAFSPLANQGPKHFDAPIIGKLAKKYSKTNTQILLRWAVDRGTVVIPKSLHAEHIAQNIDIFDFKLTEQEVDEITALNKNERTDNPNWWGFSYFA